MVRSRLALLCALIAVLGLVPIAASAAARPAGTSPVVPAAQTVPTWDLTHDMAADLAANPAPDSYGHPGVWSYEAGQYADGSDPASNTVLSPASPTSCNDAAGTSMTVWAVTDNWAPIIGSNPCSGPAVTYAHPGPSEDAVFDWQSPVTGAVSISGTISSADDGGGNGVAWLLYQGSTLLAQGSVANASSESLPNLTGVSVTAGQHLYLHINAAGNTDYDTTDVAWTITEPTAAATSTALTTDTALPVSGTPVTYTARVSPKPAGGTVAFAANGTTIPACASVAVSAAGVASCPISFSGTGSDLVTASYSGYYGTDSGSQPSTSNSIPVDVTQTDQLSGVACPTGAGCTIAGTANRWQQNAAGPAAALIATDTGGAIAALAPAAFKGSKAAVLTGASCSSVARCVVVGLSSDATKTETTFMITMSSGSPGKAAKLAAPDAATDSRATGVSCPSATCVAVGSWSDDNGNGHPLLEHLTSTGWHVIGVPNVSGYGRPTLTAVSCSDASNCTAVGYASSTANHRSYPFVDRLTGGKWHRAVLAGYPTAQLDGVSCPTAQRCVAVGSVRDGSAFRAFVAERDGTTWGGTTLPQAGGNKSDFLNGVSCWAAGQCMAAGFTDRGAGGSVLVEHLASGKWKRNVSLPLSGGDRSNADQPELDAISCASNSYCVAVGNRTDPTASGLLETWNGNRWSAG
jgi:hypothetical protein